MERRAARGGGAGDLLALVGPRPGRPSAQRARRRSCARLPKNGGVVMVTFVPSFVSTRGGPRVRRAQGRSRERTSGRSPTRPRRERIAQEVPGGESACRRRRWPRWRTTSSTCARWPGVDHVGHRQRLRRHRPTARRGSRTCRRYPDALRRAGAPRLERRGPEEAGRRQHLRAMRKAEEVATRLQAARPAVDGHHRAARRAGEAFGAGEVGLRAGRCVTDVHVHEHEHVHGGTALRTGTGCHARGCAGGLCAAATSFVSIATSAAATGRGRLRCTRTSSRPRALRTSSTARRFHGAAARDRVRTAHDHVSR